ncbi:hypothetical protein TNCV_519281 [Trichonephila clavipes]|nr:hypothetical protein TNCV_519281 [Trichonephila clavipes]
MFRLLNEGTNRGKTRSRPVPNPDLYRIQFNVQHCVELMETVSSRKQLGKVTTAREACRFFIITMHNRHATAAQLCLKLYVATGAR